MRLATPHPRLATRDTLDSYTEFTNTDTPVRAPLVTGRNQAGVNKDAPQ